MRRNSRERRGTPSRRSPGFEPFKRILLVCEGKETEPNYFEGLIADERLPSVKVKIEPAAGNTLSVVQRAVELKKVDNFDEAWAIFDKDDHPSSRFNDAFQLAAQERICIAYSNEAFELWFLLHFNLLTSALHRDMFFSKLNGYISGGYKKNDKHIFSKLKKHTNIAIKNAEKLIENHMDQNGNLNPLKDNPSTSVHELVRKLISLRKKFPAK